MKRYTIIIALLFSAFYVSAQTKSSTLDRSVRPQAAPAKPIKIADYQTFQLPNGLKVFVVENHKTPTVTYSLVLDYIPFLEGEYAGTADITGELMKTGTKTRTKSQIDEEVDFIGATLRTTSSGISGEVLTKHNEKLLDIMSDILLNPNFKPEEMEKIRKQALSGLQAEKDEPSAIAKKVGSVLMYGKNHPYGEHMTEKTLNNVTIEKCNEFYKTYFRPNIGYLAIVGDITLAQAKSLVEKYFGTWKKGEVPATKFTMPAPLAKNVVAIVDRPNAVQSTINVIYPVTLKPNTIEALQAKVVNTVLGGGSFRLFNNLREKHAWTYGAYSSLQPSKFIGSFKANTEVRNSVTDSAMVQILHEMKRIGTEPITKDELNLAKNFIMGNFGRSLEEPSTIAAFAVSSAINNTPNTYFKNYLTNVAAVTPEIAKQVAQKYIKPQNAYLLVVGKASEIAPKLQQFAEGTEIQYYDMEGNRYNPAEKTKKVEGDMNAEKVLANYIEKIGGEANIKNIKDAVIVGQTEMQGQKLSYETYYKMPDKFMVKMTMQSMVVMQQIYNSGKGQMSSPMQGVKKDLEGEELNAMKDQTVLFPETEYQKLGYAVKLLGIEKVNGKDTYKVEFSRGAIKNNEFYDVASGLKVRTESAAGVSEYADYKAVNGVLFPHALTQSAGPMNLKFNISEIRINTNLQDSLFEIK